MNFTRFLNDSTTEDFLSHITVTVNTTGDPGQYVLLHTLPLWFYIVFSSVCSLLALFILTFNAIFSAACWRTRSLRTLSNLHVISLAGADMVQALGMILQVLTYAGPTNLRKNRYLCLGVLSTFLVSMSLTFLSIAFIAVDRYIYILFPFRYPRMVSARRTVSIIAGAWCGASAFGLSILYNNNFKEEVGCHSQTTISRSYAWIRLALFVSTSLISGFCHLSIQLTALRHMRQIDVAKQVAKRMRSLRGTTASSLRLIKTFFIMYLLLLVCWLPGLIAFSLGVQGALMNVVVILAELNAVLNILVYILGNRQFRCAVADLLAQRPPTEMSI